MQVLGAVELVDLWEHGRTIGPAARAHLLLSHVYPDMSDEELEALPVGTCDDLLLQLREQTFGPQLESVVRCPNCEESLEIGVNVREIRIGPRANGAPTEWTYGDLSLQFRNPTSGDLLELEECVESQEARKLLLDRCVLEARRRNRLIEPGQLTEEEVTALAEQAAQADPGAELLLNVDCPHCGQSWQSLLDIAVFLWQELDMQVNSLLTEVHALAWAYGWRERDILAISSQRRRIYLELIGI